MSKPQASAGLEAVRARGRSRLRLRDQQQRQPQRPSSSNNRNNSNKHTSSHHKEGGQDQPDKALPRCLPSSPGTRCTSSSPPTCPRRPPARSAGGQHTKPRSLIQLMPSAQADVRDSSRAHEAITLPALRGQQQQAEGRRNTRRIETTSRWIERARRLTLWPCSTRVTDLASSRAIWHLLCARARERRSQTTRNEPQVDTGDWHRKEQEMTWDGTKEVTHHAHDVRSQRIELVVVICVLHRYTTS